MIIMMSDQAAIEGRNQTSNQRWDEMYDRLVAYKEQHGDCLVPNRYEEDPQLGAWVSTQRRHYKMLEAGESSPMTPERVERLEKIGFKWSAKNPRHLQWETRYQSLLAFKEKYGHVQVPIQWEEDVQLANWVSTQRQEYQNLLKGRTTRLDERRIRLLNNVGFAWQLQRGGRRRQLQPRRTSGSSSSSSTQAETEEDVTSRRRPHPADMEEAAAALLAAQKRGRENQKDKTNKAAESPVSEPTTAETMPSFQQVTEGATATATAANTRSSLTGSTTSTNSGGAAEESRQEAKMNSPTQAIRASISDNLRNAASSQNRGSPGTIPGLAAFRDALQANNSNHQSHHQNSNTLGIYEALLARQNTLHQSQHHAALGLLGSASSFQQQQQHNRMAGVDALSRALQGQDYLSDLARATILSRLRQQSQFGANVTATSASTGNGSSILSSMASSNRGLSFGFAGARAPGPSPSSLWSATDASTIGASVAANVARAQALGLTRPANGAPRESSGGSTGSYSQTTTAAATTAAAAWDGVLRGSTSLGMSRPPMGAPRQSSTSSAMSQEEMEYEANRKRARLDGMFSDLQQQQQQQRTAAAANFLGNYARTSVAQSQSSSHQAAALSQLQAAARQLSAGQQQQNQHQQGEKSNNKKRPGDSGPHAI